MIHSFADGHLGCFQYLAIVNCAKSRGRVEARKEVGLAGVGWRDGEKIQTTVIE